MFREVVEAGDGLGKAEHNPCGHFRGRAHFSNETRLRPRARQMDLASKRVLSPRKSNLKCGKISVAV